MKHDMILAVRAAIEYYIHANPDNEEGKEILRKASEELFGDQRVEKILELVTVKKITELTEANAVEAFRLLTGAFEEIKARREELRGAVEAFCSTFGVGRHFQDTEGTVYRVDVPKGTYVEFRTIEYKRTRRVGESKGSLSMTEAEAAGYKLPEAVKAAKKREGAKSE